MNKYISWILRLGVAVILVQTLRFKFLAHPDSVYIFTEVGLEPYGRIGIGILELIAAVLIVVPRTVWAGALLSVGLMAGAILMHLTMLGIEVKEDGGTLFGMAVGLFIVSLIVLWDERKKTPLLSTFFS